MYSLWLTGSRICDSKEGTTNGAFGFKRVSHVMIFWVQIVLKKIFYALVEISKATHHLVKESSNSSHGKKRMDNRKSMKSFSTSANKIFLVSVSETSTTRKNCSSGICVNGTLNKNVTLDII